MGLSESILKGYYCDEVSKFTSFLSDTNKLMEMESDMLRDVINTNFQMVDNKIITNLFTRNKYIKDDILLYRLALNTSEFSICDMRISQRLRIDRAVRI